MDRNQALLDEVAWLLRGQPRKHLTVRAPAPAAVSGLPSADRAGRCTHPCRCFPPIHSLQLPDLLLLVRRGNVALPVDPTHLGCLWVLDRRAFGARPGADITR